MTKERDDENECSEIQGTITSKPFKKGVYLLKSGLCMIHKIIWTQMENIT